MGRSQVGQDYQDIPLSVKVSDAVGSFGIYFKFFVELHEDVSAPSGNQQSTEVPRDACKVCTESDTSRTIRVSHALADFDGIKVSGGIAISSFCSWPTEKWKACYEGSCP